MNIAQFFGLEKSLTPGPLDPFWYSDVNVQTRAGVKVNEDTALVYSAVWACTRLLTGTGAGLPLNLFRRATGGGKAIARNHPVQKVLKAPSPRMTSMSFRSVGLNWQINWGNAYYEIERDQLDRPIRLWPIHPSRLPKGAEENDEGEIEYNVKNEDLSISTLRASEVVHVPSIVTANGINGKGVITHARESIGFGVSTERHGAAFFGNGARPGVVLRHPGRIRDEKYRQDLRRQWQDTHRGPDNAGRVALLQEGMDVTTLSISAEDSQYLQTRQHNVEEVARWYGVPPHLIGHLLRSTFNNIETQSREFTTYSLLPWLKLWEEELERKLLTEQERERGMFIKHIVEGLLRGDTEARSKFYREMLGVGVFSVNDVLELEDRNPIGPDGDKRFVPLNMTLLNEAGNEPEPEPEAPQEQPPPSSPDSEQPDDDLSQRFLDALRVTQADASLLRSDVLDAIADLRQLEGADHEWKKIAMPAALDIANDVQRWLLKKEMGAVSRALEKPAAEFFDWLDPFYESHQQFVADSLQNSVRGLLLVERGSDDQASEVAMDLGARHVAQSKEELLRAMECQPEELQERVKQTIGDWPERRLIEWECENGMA